MGWDEVETMEKQKGNKNYFKLAGATVQLVVRATDYYFSRYGIILHMPPLSWHGLLNKYKYL